MQTLDQKLKRGGESSITGKNKNKAQKQQTESSNISGSYSFNYINNHFKVNALNTPIKRKRVSEWIKNRTQLYVIFNKPTKNIQKHVD